MSDINWDEMPDWADVWIESKRNPMDSGWHKDNGDRFTDQDKLFYMKSNIKSNMDETYVVHYPPKTKPEWNGEGLPPVGTVCNYKYFRDGAICSGECKIMSVQDGFVWFKPSCAKHRVMPANDVAFVRPIKSDKQMWIQKAINCCDPDYGEIYDALISGELPLPKGVKNEHTF